MTSLAESSRHLPNQIKAWEEEASALHARAQDLVAKADTLTAQAQEHELRARNARDLLSQVQLPLSKDSKADSAEETAPKTRVRIASTKKTKTLSGPRSGSWGEVLQKWIYDADKGLTHDDMRGLISASPALLEKFSASSKGYYHGLRRLRETGHIVKDEGTFFSPKSYKSKNLSNNNSNAYDKRPPTYRHSPLGEAIFAFVSSSPGVSSAEIISKLFENPEFRAQLTPHKTHAYNVISRLTKRGHIERRDERYWPAESKPV